MVPSGRICTTMPCFLAARMVRSMSAWVKTAVRRGISAATSIYSKRPERGVIRKNTFNFGIDLPA
jgi:hypothetical protein